MSDTQYEYRENGESEPELIRIAVFDFDGTSISGQSGLLLARYMLARGFLGPIRTLRLIWWGLRYKLHVPLREAEAREIIFSALDDLTAEQISDLFSNFHDKVLVKRYRQQAIDEVRHVQEEGMVAILVSATFVDIAKKAAAYLGMDGLVATDMQKDENGRYTGEVLGDVIEGPEKTRAVQRWANEHIGEGKWIIEAAYGDHHSDTNLLDTAQIAVVVTPGRGLARAAKKRAWQIVDWD